MKSRQERCQGIPLSSIDYGESDRIVSIFTLEHGRLKGFAKGSKASRKRFGGLLEPGNRLELLLGLRDHGLCSIDQATAVCCLPELWKRLESLALAIYCFELVETTTPEGHPLPRLYRLLSALLDHLASNGANRSAQRFFEINLLNILGYCPVMEGEGLETARNCLKTGSFSKITFNSRELELAGGLLDKQLATLCCHPLKSRKFMAEMLQ